LISLCYHDPKPAQGGQASQEGEKIMTVKSSKAKKTITSKTQAAPSQARKTQGAGKSNRDEQAAAVAKVLQLIASIHPDNRNPGKDLDKAVAEAIRVCPRFKQELFEQLDEAEGNDDVQLSSSWCLSLFVTTYWLGQRLHDLPHLKARMALDRKTRLGLVEKTVLIRPEILERVKQTEGRPRKFEQQMEYALRLLIKDQEIEQATNTNHPRVEE